MTEDVTIPKQSGANKFSRPFLFLCTCQHSSSSCSPVFLCEIYEHIIALLVRLKAAALSATSVCREDSPVEVCLGGELLREFVSWLSLAGEVPYQAFFGIFRPYTLLRRGRSVRRGFDETVKRGEELAR